MTAATTQKGTGQGVSGETEVQCFKTKVDLEQQRGVKPPLGRARKPSRHGYLHVAARQQLDGFSCSKFFNLDLVYSSGGCPGADRNPSPLYAVAPQVLRIALIPTPLSVQVTTPAT